MATAKGNLKAKSLLLTLLSLIPFAAFAPLTHPNKIEDGGIKFEIADDMFWKDGEPFQIIGGDLHYFRVLPEYWEDRLMRAKALGLNTIQTYVPWNLHEPESGKFVFDGITDIVSFLKLCQKLGFLVMLRAGPYICAEWDMGGFPAWLLTIEPALKLRSSDPAYLQLVGRWWKILHAKVAPFLYSNGGPVVMVQIENEYGSYGNDKAYLHHLVKLAREHLGDDIILYTTDGGSREKLEKGTIRGDAVFSAVDFTTGDDPWPIFKLQKEFNAPGKSPPLSSEFYTGWLTHWGEKIARTDADFTAAALDKILSRNASAVLYMAHGGTNFGFYNGANTGADEYDYKADLTSYDYDAPIGESGDLNNDKFKEIRRVIMKYHTTSLPSLPSNNMKKAYGPIHLQKTKHLFDLLDSLSPAVVKNLGNPLPMESIGQMFGFVVYTSKYTSKKDGNTLLIPKVHDRAQVFLSCPSKWNDGRLKYVGKIERWSSRAIHLPYMNCASSTKLIILVENMGRVNFGQYLFDKKGILSSVYVDGNVVNNWAMFSIPFHNLNEILNKTLIQRGPGYMELPTEKKWKEEFRNVQVDPALYVGHFSIDHKSQITDTFLSLNGWSKGIAFVNEFNLGRYWPSFGPQCNLYVPAPVLHEGQNIVVIFELETPNPELMIHSVDNPDFTCGLGKEGLHDL